jgi:hypothetical protein
LRRLLFSINVVSVSRFFFEGTIFDHFLSATNNFLLRDIHEPQKNKKNTGENCLE